MPQITLKAKDVRELSGFLNRHNKDSFFLAKDDGAYIGATAGSDADGTFERIIHYFSGCNPEKDEDYYDNAAYKFGWDDFGEMLPAQWMHKAAETDGLTKAVLNVTEAGSITFKHYFKRAKALA
ncbi:MAG: DUF3085 domain-containing protein [Pseudomonadales bacterium]